MAIFHSIWTLVLFIVFIGIVVWAWSAGRRKDFDEAARLPLDDGDAGQIERDSERENTHG